MLLSGQQSLHELAASLSPVSKTVMMPYSVHCANCHSVCIKLAFSGFIADELKNEIAAIKLCEILVL